MSKPCGNTSCDFTDFICREIFSQLIRGYPELLISNIVFHILNSFTATFGNLLVLITILRTPSLRVPANALLFGLALSDFCVGCVAQPVFIKVQLLIYNNGTRSCALNVASVFLNMFQSSVTLLSITVISIDRYLAIHLHLRYQEIVTDRKVQVAVFATWIVGGVITASSFFQLRIIQWILMVLGTVCLLTVVYIWINIFLVVRHHQAQIQHQVPVENQQLNMLKFRKSAERCILLIFLYLLCYLPQMTYIARLLSNTKQNSVYLGLYFSYTFVVLNASLNPLVYCWRQRDFRTAAKQILMKVTCNVQE